MASSLAKTRSTQSQICIQHWGMKFFNMRNTDANTGDLKKLNKKCQNMAYI